MTELTYQQKYYKKNREKIRAQQKIRHQERKLADPEYMKKRRESDIRYYAERGGKEKRNKFSSQYRKDGKFKLRYEERKKVLVDMLGGKCVLCGSTEDLQFDHIDPKTKSFHITPQNSFKKNEPEMKKCQLLCFPCHLNKTFINDFDVIMEKKRSNSNE